MSTITLRPNGDSTPLNLVPVPSGTHYTALDESTASDTDYVYRTDTAGSYYYDYYAMQNHSTQTGVISSITVYGRFYGDSNYTPPDGKACFKCKFSSSGTVYSLGSAFTLAEAWTVYNSGAITTNPATGSAWSWTNIDSLIIGLGLLTGVYGGTTKCSQLYVVVTYTPPPVIDTYTRSPSSIYPGQSSTLTWTTTGATSCSINQGVGSVAVDGSKVVSPVSTTTYTLTATNVSGSVTSSVTVTISKPVINTFTRNPTSIESGESSLLSWTTTGATSCSINQGIGSVAVDGTRTVYPAATTTYTLTATNNSGSVTSSVTVTVTIAYPVVTSFTATPYNMKFGASSLLSWATTDATSISINQGIGAVASSGTKSVSPDDTTTYTITATNSAGSDTESITVTVIPAEKQRLTSKSEAELNSSPDYGRLPQMGQQQPYLEFANTLTDHYVQSLGYDFPAGDFKRPYLAKDYNTMMYAYDQDSAEQSISMKEITTAKIDGETPGKDDMFFDFSQQLASIDNFNAYAQENYRIMGKILPSANLSFSGSIESIGCDVDTQIYSGGSAKLTVVSPRFAGDKYLWTGRVKDGNGDWGKLNPQVGLSVTYITPVILANYRSVIITLLSGGVKLSEIEFAVWYEG
jgi:hypothetical protein